jgi:ATP-binding cassette subfamily B protein IrtB
VIRTLVALIRHDQRGALRGYVVLLVLSAVARAAACVLLVPLVERLFSSDPGDAWPWLGALTAATLAAWEIDRRLSARSFAIGFSLMGSIQRRVVEHLGTLPLGWFRGDHRTAARQAVATSGPELVGLLVNLVTPVVSAVLLPVAIALALLFVAWPLGLAALAATPVLLGALWLSGALLRKGDQAFAAAVSDVDQRVVEFARAQRVLRAAGRADPDTSPAGRAVDAQHRASVRVLGLAVPGQFAFSLAAQVGLLALAGTAVLLWDRGTVSAAETVALIVVTVRFLEPFTSLADLAPAVESSRNLLVRLRTVLDASPLESPPDDPPGWRSPSLGSPPTVTVRDVSFAYPGGSTADAADPADGADAVGPLVLDGCSFTVPAGTTTAIVGPSGSGKSTILALLARDHDVLGGSVCLDDHDVRALQLSTLMATTAAVFQDVYLFDGTIRDNVAVADPGADQAALDRVARLARVDEIVARLPDGWDTRVGEGGTALSGGERQRVSVARALLKPAPVLLVDEATSALDAENSDAVVAALDAEAGRRTTLVVAHRIETIEHADQVVFLDGGRIVEHGTPAELVAAGGRFATYWHQRRASGSWTIGSSDPAARIS